MSPTLIRELGLVTVDGGPGRAHSKYVHTDWMTRWNLLGGTRSGSYHDEGRSRSGSATVVFRVRTYLVLPEIPVQMCQPVVALYANET